MRTWKICAPIAALAAAALASPAAQAFCGFYVSGADTKLYNNATMVVLMREGQRTVLSMQNNYQGPPSDFAMVVPVPIVLQKENVKTLNREIFDHVDSLAAPRLVEYWEQDPCQPQVEEDMAPPGVAGAAAPLSAVSKKEDRGVTIEAKFSVGEYDILILSARDSGGLDAWLRENHYKIPQGAEAVLRPYVAQGMKFFVAKVDAKKVKFENGQAMLSPLRFHYDTNQFSLPVRLGLLNSNGVQDLLVHILARGKRYEVANYPNTFIPTNYDVNESAKATFGEFYAALFDKTIEKHPGAVVTEYSWDANSCDPCPTPPLEAEELLALGADVTTPQGPQRPPTATNPDLAATVTIGDIDSGKKVENAGRTVETLRPAFETCYKNQLANVLDPRGSLEVDFKLGTHGEISEIKTSDGKGLPVALVECVVNSFRAVRFQPPKSAARIKIPLTFDLQRAPAGGGWLPMPPAPPLDLYGFTLTRLHARYSKEALGEDLVFREAPPVVGGREDFGAKIQDHGAKTDAGGNNFQGRYIIRHPWTGPVTCANPRRGVWGGPPTGDVPNQTIAAKNTAFAPRGKVDLASFLGEDIPELQVAAGTATNPNAVPVTPGARGCGACMVENTPKAVLPGALAALAALLASERRRARRAKRAKEEAKK